MSEYTLRGSPKPFNIIAVHPGATSETTITGMVIDGVSSTVGYYKVKAGSKAKIYEVDAAVKDETIVNIEQCKNVTTSPLTWVKVKKIEVSAMGHVGRSWRYPLILEAYEYDMGIKISFQQTSGAQVNLSMHGEVSPLT